MPYIDVIFHRGWFWAKSDAAIWTLEWAIDLLVGGALQVTVVTVIVTVRECKVVVSDYVGRWWTMWRGDVLVVFFSPPEGRL